MAELNALQNNGVALAHADAHGDQRVALAAHIRLGVYEALDVLPHEEVREVAYVLTRGGVLLRSEPRQEELLTAPVVLTLRGLRMNESSHWEVVFTEDSLVLDIYTTNMGDNEIVQHLLLHHQLI